MVFWVVCSPEAMGVKLLGISRSFCLCLLERKARIERVKNATQHTDADAIIEAMAIVDSLQVNPLLMSESSLPR